MNSILLILLVLTLSTSSILYAGPASPDPFEIEQPDGNIFSVFTRGDEFQGWTESTETGHTVLLNLKSGYWEYAEQDHDGSLKPNGIRVLPHGQNSPFNIPKGLRPPRNKDRERHMQHMLRKQAQIESTSVMQSAVASFDVTSSAIWYPSPVAGTKKLLIIIVSFADRAIQTTPSGWYNKIFDESDKSVSKFYKDNSFGLMRVSPTSHSQAGSPEGTVSVTLPTNHPNTGNNYTFASDQAWGNSALALASNYVDFNSLDTNNNGILETSEVVIYFIVSGFEAASNTSNTPAVWAHAWSTTGIGLTAGNKNVQRWGQNGELNGGGVQLPMGVIVHELGHQMCDLPDLYDISNTNAGLGNFSVMASGSWGRDYTDSYSGTTPVSLDAWSREYLGWSTPVIPDMSNPPSPFSFANQLATNSTPYKLVLPATSTSEYFLIENRWPTGWDLGLRGMSYFGSTWQGGLLILHVDNSAGISINSYDNANNRQGVVPVQASTSICNMLASGSSGTCRGNPKTLFYSGNNSTWSPASTPNTNYYSGLLTDFYLTSISSRGATMTAEFSYGAPTEPDVPNIGIATRGNGQVSVSFSAPSNDGGSSISSYTVISLPGGKTSSGASSPLTVAGLTNGTAYTFKVSATNGIGTSLPSNASNSVTPATVPDAPTIGTVTVGNGQVTVSFSSPSSDGGSDITSFIVTSSAGHSASSAMSPVTVPGLTNGSVYTFSVRATNSVGPGANSASSASVITGPVRNSGFNTEGYLTLQSAYAADTHTPEIQIVAASTVGPLVKADSDTVTIGGGYDAAFTNSSGLPAVLGPVFLRNGTTRLRNVVIRP